MSSKSKQHSRKGKRAPQAPGAEAAAAADHHEGALGIPDEVVHVPKETSALRFLLMIGLIIVLLVIFIVPQAILGTVSRQDEGETFVRWTGPDGQPVEYGYDSFRNEKRMLANALGVDPFLAGVIGVEGRNPTDEQLARFLILDQLAASSGLHVPDADLVAHLRQLAQLYGGVTQYKSLARRAGGEQAVESSVRRILRAARYLQVTAFLGAVPEPEAIQELWDTEREELAFEFGVLAYDSLEDDARAELPLGDDLSAWFDGLDPARRQPLELAERRSAEIVSFLDAATTPGTGLVAAYPEETVEGEEPPTDEERARQYYDQVYFWHFLNPAEETEDAASQRPTYVPFEDVRDVALTEAPAYFAMQKWLTELRAAEEQADLAQLAEEYGLAHEVVSASTREEYRDIEEYRTVGDTFATRVFQIEAGEFAYSVVPRGGALSIVRVSEVIGASMPDFADIRDQVADMWVQDRVQELAVERLDQVRDTFSTEPLVGESDHEEVEGQEHNHRYADAETFKTALAGLGIDVQWRDWADKGLPAVSDPALDEATNGFFRRLQQLQGLSDDEVAPPQLDPVEGRAYLVRNAGRRPVPIENMSPVVFDGYKARAGTDRRRALLSEPTQEYLQREFGLEFIEPVVPEEGAEGAEDAEDAEDTQAG